MQSEGIKDKDECDGHHSTHPYPHSQSNKYTYTHIPSFTLTCSTSLLSIVNPFKFKTTISIHGFTIGSFVLICPSRRKTSCVAPNLVEITRSFKLCEVDLLDLLHVLRAVYLGYAAGQVWDAGDIRAELGE